MLFSAVNFNKRQSYMKTFDAEKICLEPKMIISWYFLKTSLFFVSPFSIHIAMCKIDWAFLRWKNLVTILTVNVAKDVKVVFVTIFSTMI